jgi:GNAT superfamily N-acetyltransferase
LTFGEARPPCECRVLDDPREIAGLALPPLSTWFDPFLPHFMREAMRCQGEVRVCEDPTTRAALGVYLYNPSENLASIFTPRSTLATEYADLRPRASLFAEVALPRPHHVLEIRRTELKRWTTTRALTTRVRAVGPDETEPVERLLREVGGALDASWFHHLPTEETCFVAEADGTVVGAGVATRVGRWGRVHSLAVRAPHRRLGVGSDLLQARLMWLQAQGAEQAISEIRRDNLPSKRVADRFGMSAVGEMYLYPPAPLGAMTDRG